MIRQFSLYVSVLILSACASFGPSSSIRLSSYRDIELKNGMKVILVEDRTLPFVGAGLLLKSGASQDPMGKSGLSDMTAQLLERGTKKKSATEIADAFGQLGTSFSASVDEDSAYFATSGLSSQQNELLDLFFEVLVEPSFSVREVSRIRSEFLSGIRRSYDHPSYVASRAFSQLLYGPHPYGRSVSGSERDVGSIKQKDVIRHYLKYYRPNNAILVLVGDLNKGIKEDLERRLASWQPRNVEKSRLPALIDLKGLQIHLAHRADLKQSEVRMGHFGVRRNIEDYQILEVAETILSGGFTSRLMSEIRVKRGLTYGISSTFDAREENGPFVISTNTRHEKVGEMIRETRNVLNEFYEKGATKQEVEEAKGYLRGAFPRRIETPSQMAQMLVGLRFYGIDDGYMTNYIRNLNKISVSDVNRVIKKYYRPKDMRVLVYGPKAQVLNQLRPLGAIEVKNYKEFL